MTIPIGDVCEASKPAENVVDLWLLADHRNRELPVDSVSAFELKRAERYRSAEKRRQFLFSRVLGRRILSHYFCCEPHELNWPESGVPVIRGPHSHNRRDALCVSLAHSEKVLALAVGCNSGPIGVDVEAAISSLNVPALCNVALTSAEQQQLAGLATAQQTARLLEFWTLKEAALKSLRKETLPDPRQLEVTRIDEAAMPGKWIRSLIQFTPEAATPRKILNGMTVIIPPNQSESDEHSSGVRVRPPTSSPEVYVSLAVYNPIPAADPSGERELKLEIRVAGTAKFLQVAPNFLDKCSVLKCFPADTIAFQPKCV